MLKTGIYEQLINNEISTHLEEHIDKLIKTAPIDEAEAPKIFAKYISEVIEYGHENIKDSDGNIQTSVGLNKKLLE